MYPGYIFYVNRRVSDGFDRNTVQILRRLRRTVEHVHLVFGAADLGCSCWQDQILQCNRVYDVERGEKLGLERVRIQIDFYLALLPPIRIGDRRSGNRNKLGTNEVEAVVIKLLF